MKILAIKFKYLGDVAVMVPALRALRERFPQAELHVLVAEEAAPLLSHLSWIDRVWGVPRRRGKAQFFRTLPILRALRRERFDRSVDFVGNDRGGWLSLGAGAGERLGLRPRDRQSFLARFFYTHRQPEPPHDRHESLRDIALLEAWGVPPPSHAAPEIAADPALAGEAAALLPKGRVLLHLSTSQPKKEWPVARWAALADLAEARGMRVAFSAGTSPREQADLEALRSLRPGSEIVPPVAGLSLFLAVLARAGMFVGGDTGPLHFAAGLGVPTVALYGPSIVSQWAPLNSRGAVLTGTPCTCSGHAHVCYAPARCIDAIAPEAVVEEMERLLRG
ncbi:MAG: glycosyltransferase family 9 protein [Verrucomicrobium sp.]|nr:glycosyltransferase family 9 protein [Verrucomicrobium sp.]